MNTNSIIIFEPRPISKGSRYYRLSDNKNRVVFKYMSLEAAILCLENANLRFVEPDQWTDPFESRFYRADYSNVLSRDSEYPKKVFACCFTLNKDSEAAWKAYSSGDGLKGRCVKIKCDLREIRRNLQSYCGEGYLIYEGLVNYDLSDEDIESLHYYDSRLYSTFFSHLSIKEYLSLLLIKRPAFYYEKELRIFIIPDSDKGSEAKEFFPSIVWKNVIKEIVLDERCSSVEFDIFRRLCINNGIPVGNSKGDVRITKSQLHAKKEDSITIGADSHSKNK